MSIDGGTGWAAAVDCDRLSMRVPVRIRSARWDDIVPAALASRTLAWLGMVKFSRRDQNTVTLQGGSSSIGFDDGSDCITRRYQLTLDTRQAMSAVCMIGFVGKSLLFKARSTSFKARGANGTFSRRAVLSSLPTKMNTAAKLCC
jgi:hypothetical protein